MTGGTTDGVSAGGVGVNRYWPINAVTTNVSTAAGANQRTFHVNGTLSSVVVTISSSSSSRSWTFTLLKNGVADGTCTIPANGSTCTITVGASGTFANGDKVVMQAQQTTGAADNNRDGTWTSTYTFGTPVIS
jgi:hypothetical protein